MIKTSLFNDSFSINNLTQVYENRISLKATAGLDRINKASFKPIENIEIISRKVLLGKYKFTPYKEKLISKGKDKFPRVISIPTIRDKITLGVLKDVLTSEFSDLLDLKISTSIVQELKEAIKLGTYEFFIKIDIKSFYDSIPHTILLKKVRQKIKNKEIQQLLVSALENPTVSVASKEYKKNVKGVPQGISISNILANIYLLDIDKKYSKYNNVAYFRYVDDILILCKKNNHKRVLNSLKIDLCKKLELSMNDKQDNGLLSKEFDYLGYKYALISATKYGFTIKEKNLNKLKDSLIKIISAYRNHKNSELFLWELNLRITGFIIDRNKYGWLYFYSLLDDISILYELDWLINKICIDFGVNKQLIARVKKFVRAYHEIVKKKGKSDYLPRLSNFNLTQKKSMLKIIFGVKQELIEKSTDEQIHFLFKEKMSIAVKELEKDVQETY